ncbi:hypothetical protein CDAR_430461 [Caerostris darwini]|uniref:Uncharacterized protein n=1 Tax=Caerostris darwini TaxID=1538125 RepID=A0AAV4SQ23_9ARAC|nr:hypothetical protein CDAR_430461 [Caerostris darwini]
MYERRGESFKTGDAFPRDVFASIISGGKTCPNIFWNLPKLLSIAVFARAFLASHSIGLLSQNFSKVKGSLLGSLCRNQVPDLNFKSAVLIW